MRKVERWTRCKGERQSRRGVRKTRIHPFRRNVIGQLQKCIRSSRIIFQSNFGKRNVEKSSPIHPLSLYIRAPQLMFHLLVPTGFLCLSLIDGSGWRNFNIGYSLTDLLIFGHVFFFFALEFSLFFSWREHETKLSSIYDRLILIII